MTANKVLLKAENSNKNNHGIKLLYTPQDVFVEADKGRINQVITNLTYIDVSIMNKEEIGLSVACSMSMHDTCKVNIDDVRKCGCNCHE
jgi:signal transduction histidine kinase